MILEELVKSVKNGNVDNIEVIHRKFKPLIFSWLKQSKELYFNEKEDFESMAKIILIESIYKFDESKKIPFQSYYKINLYHWYSNFKRKKKINTISLQNINYELIFEEDKEMDYYGKKEAILIALKNLNYKERIIIEMILDNKSIESICEKLNISKKTFFNKKYEAIKKIKYYINN